MPCLVESSVEQISKKSEYQDQIPHQISHLIFTKLVGTHDGRTQSARAWLFFFLHLDGLKTPIYTQTIVKWN